MTKTPSELARSPWFIFALALSARLALMIGMYTAAVPLPAFWGTGLELGHVAQSLAAGAGFASPFGGSTGPTAMLAPGYPLLVAAVFRLLGPSSAAAAWTVLAFQCLFSALTCLVIFAIGEKTFGRTAGVIAAWLWAVLPSAMLVPVFRFWDTSLTALLFTTAFLLLLSAGDSRRRWLVWGLLTGALTLINPAVLPCLLLLAAWSCWRAGWRRTLIPALLAVVVVAALLAPWTWRNYRVFGRVIPLRSNFGMELWMGNHAGGNGETQLQFHPATDPDEFARFRRAGEVQYFRQKQAEAVRFIRSHPGTFARLTLWRVGQSWTAGADLWGFAAFALPVIWAGLAGLGLLLWRRHPLAAWFAVPLVIYPLPFYITHPDARFRHALEPLLFSLATHLMIEVYSATRRRPEREKSAAARAGESR